VAERHLQINSSPAPAGRLRALRRILLPALLLWIMVFAVGCAGSVEPQALRFSPAPWQDGEQSTFAVAGNETETTGTATFDITSGANGWTLRREISALGDREIAVVETGTEGYRPASSTMVRMLSDGAVEQVRATYSGGTADLELITRQNVTTYERFNVPTDARDQRSIPFLVRALPLAEGYATRLNTFLPITGILDRYTISVVRREQVTVPAGDYDTWRVRLDTGDTVSHIWVGVDAPHPIVKFDDGRANATYELQSFKAGG
jgi:hypothetical protein